MCDRTHNKCAWDKKHVYCHVIGRDAPAEANGKYFTGEYCDNGKDGPRSIAIYSVKKPKKLSENPKYREDFQKKNKNVTDAIIAIEVKVDELAMMIAEGYETVATAGVALASWCKENRHDKFAATQLLNEKLKKVKEMRAGFSVNEDHKLVKDDRLLREKLGKRLRFN